MKRPSIEEAIEDVSRGDRRGRARASRIEVAEERYEAGPTRPRTRARGGPARAAAATAACRESGRSSPARWCCCWRSSSCTRTGTRSRAIRGSAQAIIGIYGALGANLQPDWNLHAYEILQWHLGSDPALPGTLKVRASLKNVASFAQPYPLLKLVLEDRWGESVREREFEPAEYLDPATAPDRLLGPAQQATATISIVDPGTDAEGFRFDVCLRGSRGVVCAADVPVRR